MKKIIALAIILLLLGGIVSVRTFGSFEVEKKAEKYLRSMGLDEKLDAGVVVSQREKSLISIKDQGIYLTHYTIMGPNETADANIVVDAKVEIPATADNILVVTHGWFDKATDWPAQMAEAIHGKVDANEWVCISYDWQGGAWWPIRWTR